MVLEYAGGWAMMTPSVWPAEEYSGALAQVTGAIANLWELAESGMFKDRAEQFRDHLDQLEQRRAELAAKPSRPAETTWTPAGKSVRDHWLSLEPASGGTTSGRRASGCRSPVAVSRNRRQGWSPAR